MATALYPKAKEDFLSGNIDLTSDTIKAVLVTSAYTYSASHEDLADVGAGTRVAISSALTNPDVTSGVFDADDVLYDNLTGSTFSYVILFKDTGSEASSRLILYIDSFASGMPNTPNGADRTVQWSDGSSKIFAL